MSFYPHAVQKRFNTPQCVGIVESPNAVGRSASFQCGSFIAFSLRIDIDSKTVSEATFRSNGCGFMIAAADVLAEFVNGRQLGELHGLNADDLSSKIDNVLSGLPDDRRQCVDVCIEALRQAFADFRIRQIEEFRGEKGLICTCFGITEETVETHIREGGTNTVDEISRICNAGSGCGSCRMLIQEMIDLASDET